MHLEPFSFKRTRDRRSIRLKDFDYSQPGAYFVTIVARKRKCMFGELVDGTVWLSNIGKIVAETWEWLEKQYPYVELDAWVVMPNHLHGVIMIHDDSDHIDGRGGSRTAPTPPPTKRKPLGRLVGAFKTVSTKRVNKLHGTPGATLWQRNYYEHGIRDQADLDDVRQYIVANPAHWAEDEENPAHA